LIDTFHLSNSFLGKLFVVEAGHLASQKEPTTGVLAPNSVKGQMWLTANSLFGCIRRLIGANGDFQFRLTLHKLPRLTSMTKEPKVSCRQERKKPTWWNTQGHSATSAYSSTNLPAKPGCSSASHPTA